MEERRLTPALASYKQGLIRSIVAQDMGQQADIKEEKGCWSCTLTGPRYE